MRDVKYSALAGNRTPVSRVAGENSTTEPPARYTALSFLRNFYYVAVDLNNSKLFWELVHTLSEITHCDLL